MLSRYKYSRGKICQNTYTRDTTSVSSVVKRPSAWVQETQPTAVSTVTTAMSSMAFMSSKPFSLITVIAPLLVRDVRLRLNHVLNCPYAPWKPVGIRGITNEVRKKIASVCFQSRIIGKRLNQFYYYIKLSLDPRPGAARPAIVGRVV